MADEVVEKSYPAAQDTGVLENKSKKSDGVRNKTERTLAPAVSKEDGELEGPAASPDRVQYSHFVQALWSLLKDGYHMRHSTAFGEARMFDAAEGLRYLVRSFEGGPVDAALISSPADMTDVPAQGCSYTELWCWARNQSDVHFIPFDVKYVQLQAEPLISQEYTSSGAGRRGAKDLQNAEFYIVVFEGCPRSFAIVPPQSWKRAVAQGYGVEPLIDGIPLWYQPFMVHSRHLVRALRSLIRASRGIQPCYTNPSMRVKIRGWKLGGMTNPRIDPMGEMQVLACNSFLRLRQQIRSVGGTIHYNHVAPLLYDATASLPATEDSLQATGMLDYELKFTKAKCRDAMLKTRGRWSPLAKRRLWHVLWLECEDGIVCITRDESPIAWARSVRTHYRSKLPLNFLKNHYFRSYSAAFNYIREHASLAKAAVRGVIESISPRGIDRHLSTRSARRALETMADRNRHNDPLAGPNAAQTSLPWVVGVLNEWCRKAGFGIILPLDPRHPWGDHIFLEYTWSEADKKRRRLPRAIFDSRVRNARCIVLRFLDLTPTSNLAAGCPIAMRSAYWKKPLRDGHFILLGSVLSRELQERDTPRSSSYLLLPSEFTSMWAPQQFIPKPPKKQREDGRSIFQRVSAESRRLPNYGGGRGAQPFDFRFLSDPSTNLNRYVLNLVDGTIFLELRKILESTGPCSISHPLASSPNKKFDPTLYHTTVSRVHQAAIDYGYTLTMIRHYDTPARRARKSVHIHAGWRRRQVPLQNPRLGRGGA